MNARTATDYSAQLRQLLPPGAAWAFPGDGNFAALLAGLAEEFARVEARAGQLADEADPRTALELLADWETTAGLPDACTGQPDNAAERRVALHQKIIGLGGQSRSYYVELAARLGYVIEIEEHRVAQLGMRLGENLNGEAWQYAWTVHVLPLDGDLGDQFFIAQAEIGDELGVRLRGFGALDLECIIRRAAPAHTTVIFAYDVEAEPEFWIDFTQ